MRGTPVVLLLVMFMSAGPAVRGEVPVAPSAGEEALAQYLYKPKLVLDHMDEIGLTPAQRTVLRQLILEASRVAEERRPGLVEARVKLEKLLAEPRVDEAAASAALDAVTELERDVRRSNLVLLVRLKNVLTAEQQVKLSAIRER